jgi:ankyrin repeat protein
MYACRSNNLVLIDCLINHGADLNLVDDNNLTALSHASNKGHLKCVQKLLAYNADPLIYSNDYLYPYDLAEKSGYTDIKNLIMRFLKCKKIDSIKSDKEELVKFLDSDEESEKEDEDDGLVYKKNN